MHEPAAKVDKIKIRGCLYAIGKKLRTDQPRFCPEISRNIKPVVELWGGAHRNTFSYIKAVCIDQVVVKPKSGELITGDLLVIRDRKNSLVDLGAIFRQENMSEFGIQEIVAIVLDTVCHSDNVIIAGGAARIYVRV